MRVIYLVLIAILFGIFLQLWASNGFKVKDNGIVVYAKSVGKVGESIYLLGRELAEDDVDAEYPDLDEVSDSTETNTKPEVEENDYEVDEYEDIYDY